MENVNIILKFFFIKIKINIILNMKINNKIKIKAMFKVIENSKDS